MCVCGVCVCVCVCVCVAIFRTRVDLMHKPRGRGCKTHVTSLKWKESDTLGTL